MATASMRAWYETGPHDKTDSADDTADATSSSLLLYALLPSLVQRRIPKLKSFRKALSHYDQRGQYSRSLSQTSVTSVTPPPSYHSSPEDRESLDEQRGPYFRSFGRSSEPASRPSSSGTSTPIYLEEARSGVQWKYADPGFALLSLSSQEAATGPRSSNLVRRQYIDGIACCLRGLPTDLSLEEELSLREALPSTLHADTFTDSHLLVRQNPRIDIPYSSSAAAEPSALHDFIASVTLNLFLLISFITPYINLLLRSAYAFDRKHKVSDRALAGGVAAADVAGRQALAIAQEVCGWNEGKVGEVASRLGAYLVQGIGGGVVKGVGEGMIIAKKRRREEEEEDRRGRAGGMIEGRRGRST